MVQQRTNIPSVGTMATPQCSGLGGYIDDSLTPQRGEWKAVPIIRPMNDLYMTAAACLMTSPHAVQDNPRVAAGIHCW
jgi:hypothetical protein